MKPEPPRFSQALNALRFFAALWVVSAHFGIQPLRTLGAPAALLDLLQTRSFATSFFFILSGFLLTHSQHRKRTNVRRFFVRRFSRIYPVHAACFMAMVPTAFVGAQTIPLHDVAIHALLWLTALHGFFPQVQLLYNAPAWAVTSFAFGYLSVMWTKRWIDWSTKALGLALVALWTIDLLPNLWLVHTFATNFQYSFPGDPSVQVSPALESWTTLIHGFPLFRVAEVMFGSTLAILSLRVSSLRRPRWWATDTALVLLGVGTAALLSVMGGRPESRFLAGHALLLPIVAVGIFGIWFNSGHVERILSARILQTGGNSSMLIYFGHWPACWAVIWFSRRLLGVSVDDARSNPLVFGAMLAAFLLPAFVLQRPYDRFCGAFEKVANMLWDRLTRAHVAHGADTSEAASAGLRRETIKVWE